MEQLQKVAQLAIWRTVRQPCAVAGKSKEAFRRRPDLPFGCNFCGLLAAAFRWFTTTCVRSQQRMQHFVHWALQCTF